MEKIATFPVRRTEGTTGASVSVGDVYPFTKSGSVHMHQSNCQGTINAQIMLSPEAMRALAEDLLNCAAMIEENRKAKAA